MHHGSLSTNTAKGLAELRARIAQAGIPSSKLDETLNIATWNIREFGRKARQEASLHYIAEIIGQFDIVSLVEVRDNLQDLSTVLRYLGPYWRVVFSDFLVDAGGNRERIAFVYDERAVTFTGLASTAVAARKKNGTEWAPTINWWRTPYICSFSAGNFDFVLLAAHVRWGKSEKGRLPELEALAEWVEAKQKHHGFDDDIIVLGDFNIPAVHSPLYDAITGRGLRMPSALADVHGSDLAKGKRYDQILHNPKYVKSFTDVGGVLDFYQGDHAPLFPGQKLTKTQFTFQLSDHLPLWIHVNTDTDDEQLDQIVNPRRKK